MSSRSLASTIRRLREVSLEALWRQWGSLGIAATSRSATSLIDPEALALFSLALVEEERRLWDLLGWWARSRPQLLSVQRVRNLAQAYPAPAQTNLYHFAHLALSDGGDFRWKPMARPQPGKAIRPTKGRGERVNILAPQVLLLRLRLGLNVGIKADILGYLLGIHGGWASIREIADALAYAPRAIRRAADDMAEARFIEGASGVPVRYRADLKRWTGLLGIKADVPAWRHWQPVFAFVAHLFEWHGQAADLSPYLLSSRARDLIAAHPAAFARNDIAIPRPEDYLGEEYLKPFADTLDALATWMRENV